MDGLYLQPVTPIESALLSVLDGEMWHDIVKDYCLDDAELKAISDLRSKTIYSEHLQCWVYRKLSTGDV